MKKKIILFTIIFFLLVPILAFAQADYTINSIVIESDKQINTLYEYVYINLEQYNVKADYILKNDNNEEILLKVKLPKIQGQTDTMTASIRQKQQILTEADGYYVLDLKLGIGEAKKINFLYSGQDLNSNTLSFEYKINPNVFKVQDVLIYLGDKMLPQITPYFGYTRYDGRNVYSLKEPYTNTYERSKWWDEDYNPHSVKFISEEQQNKSILEATEDEKYSYEKVTKFISEADMQEFLESKELARDHKYADAFLKLYKMMEVMKVDTEYGYSYYNYEYNGLDILNAYLSYYCFEYMIGEEENIEVNNLINSDEYQLFYDTYTISTYYISEIPLKGKIIVIDPGHQAKENNEQEPLYEGSTETKAKNTTGGIIPPNIWDSLPDYIREYNDYDEQKTEYMQNLNLAKSLKEQLQYLGATVIMTREENDVDLSNIERAEIANKEKAHLSIKIHCDSFDDESASGFSVLIPKNEHLKEPSIYNISKLLAEFVIKNLKTSLEEEKHWYETVPLKIRGIYERADMVGFNWSEVPTILVENGFLTNKDDATYLINGSGYRIMNSIKEAILQYFGTQEVLEYYKQNGYSDKYTDDEVQRKEILKLSVELEKKEDITPKNFTEVVQIVKDKFKIEYVIIGAIIAIFVTGIFLIVLPDKKAKKVNKNDEEV